MKSPAEKNSNLLSIKLDVKQVLILKRFHEFYFETVHLFFPENIRCLVLVTLQRVEDSEQVGEGHVGRPPGEQSEAPCHPKQEGEADHASQVSENLDHSRET